MSSTFQSILLAVFGFLGVIAVLIFAGLIPMPGEQNTYGGEVTLWGMIPQDTMDDVVIEFNEANKEKYQLAYEYHSATSFEDELVAALARGEGPDIVIFPQDLIVSQGDKIMPISYETISERTFKETFADIGNMYLSEKGILALPLYVDPIVMYWNKDLFTNAGLAAYPKNWTEFLKLPDVLTKKDDKGNIFQSTVAFGTFKNVTNAKDILSLLLLQVGDGIVTRRYDDDTGARTDEYVVELNQPAGAAESAFNFYTEFANQARAAYSWNSSLAASAKAFEAGKLAVYFGFASEYQNIKRNNPHLNFDVAAVPQRSDASTKITFGKMKGLGVLKASDNATTAYNVAVELAGADYAGKITKAIYLPSLRRDILSMGSGDPVLSVFDLSAIMSRAWFDPSSGKSESIFKDVIESVLSGRNSDTGAIGQAQIKLFELVK